MVEQVFQVRKFRITGRVQKVGMRYWICSQCTVKQIGGWVRNERDGSVTALFSGSKAKLDEAAIWLAQGPPGAAVHVVKVLAPSDSELEETLPNPCTAMPTPD